MDKSINLDRVPALDPALNIGDLLKWGLIGEQVAAAISEAIATGETTAPVIKIRLNGEEWALGPTPVKKLG